MGQLHKFNTEIELLLDTESLLELIYVKFGNMSPFSLRIIDINQFKLKRLRFQFKAHSKIKHYFTIQLLI